MIDYGNLEMEGKDFSAVDLHGSGYVGPQCADLFMERELVEQMWETGMGPGMMLFMAIFWWVPLVMAVLSVTLKDVANRWANRILGIIFVILSIFHLLEHLAEPSAHQLLIVGSTVVVAALIAWFAFKWPKQEA